MKLFTKGLLLIAVPSVVELLLVGVLLKTQRDALEAERWALHGKQVIYQAASILGPMLQQTTRLQAQVITGSPAAAVTDPGIWSDLEGRAATLRQMVANDPAQAKRAAELGRTVTDFHRQADRITGELRAGHQAAVLEWYRSPTRPKLAARLRQQLSELLTAEQALDEVHDIALTQARRSQHMALLAAALGAILASGLAAFALMRGAGRRWSILIDNAGRLAQSRELATPLGGKDEISRLDHALHRTALRLRRAEQAQARMHAALEVRAAELLSANEHLRQQTQDNEMFIYSVSHDLRSPLVNLQGFSKELKASCQDLRRFVDTSSLPAVERQRFLATIDGEMAEALHYLQTAVTRAASIVDSLLRLSRARRIDYRWQQVDVGAIVARVVDAMRQTVKEQRATVVARNLRSVWGDAGTIEQIFGNLIGNAVAYLDPRRPGHIEIGVIDTPPATSGDDTTGSRSDVAPWGSDGNQGVLAASDLPPALCTFYVKDNGLGIPAAYLPKMFSAFQRFHGDVAHGEGVGLALVRRMVERHGGRVWLESREGVGTTFFVSLPQQAPRIA